MDLIIGGAYQGKKDFAKEHFGLSAKDIYTCTCDGEPDWNARCIEHLEQYVLYCVRIGTAPKTDFRPDAVLIGDDIFCGVVSVDPVERAWREETGRYFGRLSQSAETVHRLFCGLPMQLK